MRRILALLTWSGLVAFFVAVLAMPLPALGAEAPADDCLNCDRPMSKFRLGVGTRFDQGEWKIAPTATWFGEVGPKVGQSVPFRLAAEVSFVLRSGDEPSTTEDAAALDIVSANAVRGRVIVKRVIGRTEYPANPASTDQRVRRVLTSLYGDIGVELVIDRDSNIEPAVARQGSIGICVDLEKGEEGDRVASVSFGVGFDESTWPATPIPGPDGKMPTTAVLVTQGQVPILSRFDGRLVAILFGRQVTNLRRVEGYRDPIDFGVTLEF